MAAMALRVKSDDGKRFARGSDFGLVTDRFILVLIYNLFLPPAQRAINRGATYLRLGLRFALLLHPSDFLLLPAVAGLSFVPFVILCSKNRKLPFSVV